ncbi:hypothetical protein AAHA92_26513 [Salvia divinorum]|uniref:S-protein homolog n=1 Tax=Salvia divinorum TaxID=28513 RepID=A0ABD1GEG5_SALDI
MMKYNLFLLIASSLLLQAASSPSNCFTTKYEVYIRSDLPSPLLNIHCFSKDDDLGYHDLAPKAEYRFAFCENPLATLFSCHYKWNGKDKKFHAYDATTSYNRCNKGICYYIVKPDGFYFSNVYPPNQGRFLCDWNPTTPCK